MALKTGHVTLNKLLIISCDSTPIPLGLSSVKGSYASSEDGSGLFYKYGNLDTEWIAIDKVLVGSATLDFPNLSPNSYADLNITVNGAVVGDCVTLGIPISSLVGLVIFNSFVSASNTVTVRAYNLDGNQIDPPSGLFKVVVSKSI